MNELLNAARINLHKTRETEVALLQTNDAVKDLWQARQDLVSQMNQEIHAAVQLIRDKYAPQLDALDSDYGMYLQMITPAQQSHA